MSAHKHQQALGAEAARQAAELADRQVEEAYARGFRDGQDRALHADQPTDPEAVDTMTVLQARARLREQIKDGIDCPVCLQHAKVYRRPLTSVAVRALAALYITHSRAVGHLPTIARGRLRDVAHQGGYLTLSQHWGLMIDERAVRPDGGRAGYWRVTDLGEQFLHGETTVPKYAVLYNGGRIELAGDPVGVRDALGETFDYEQITARADITTADTGRLFFLPETAAAAA